MIGETNLVSIVTECSHRHADTPGYSGTSEAGQFVLAVM